MVALCRVCQRARAQYTCPRCEAAYCSLACYRAHGAQCTESFYQAQVQEELRSTSASGEERKHLERMVLQLSRLDDEGGAGALEEEADSEGEDPEEDRLEALVEKAQRGELCVEDLSEEEARRFHAELKSGSLGRTLGAWEPWWQRAAVTELDALDDGDAFAARAPVAHVCCTASRSVSPLVAVTVLEALYAYAHAMRAFNGDWSWDALQVASHLLHLARAVSTQRVYQTAGECLHAARRAASSLPGGGFGASFDQLCLGDAARLLTRRGGTLVRALLEAAAIVSKARELALGDGACSKATGGLLRSAKKLEFLASFAEHHEDACLSLAPEVQALVEVSAGNLESIKQGKQCREHDGIALPLLD